MRISLKDCGLESDDLEKKVTEACKPGLLFEGVQTRFKREKYYTNHFYYQVLSHH